MKETNEELLTTDDIESRYKIDKQTQKIYREKHGLPFMKPGKRIFYRKADVDAWVDELLETAKDNAEEHY